MNSANSRWITNEGPNRRHQNHETSKILMGFHVIDVETLLEDLSGLRKLRKYTTACLPS